jgi:hypothetical protein
VGGGNGNRKRKRQGNADSAKIGGETNADDHTCFAFFDWNFLMAHSPAKTTTPITTTTTRVSGGPSGASGVFHLKNIQTARERTKTMATLIFGIAV